ncbi:hypothetical protein DXG01_011153 [Tephrocybe rancida]|nr:hypothetical protein DXG01_011153 [Tephrocybe rancida]
MPPRPPSQMPDVPHEASIPSTVPPSQALAPVASHPPQGHASTSQPVPSQAHPADDSLPPPTVPALPTSSLAPVSRKVKEIDALASRKYASQMPPVFTQQYAIEQEINEWNRNKVAAKNTAIRKAKNSMIVFGWGQDGVESTVYEFQEGFVWPHFVITESVISLLDFATETSQVKIYNCSICMWTKILLGHVVELWDNEQVLLKAIHVTDCLDLDNVLARTLRPSMPNITNIATERAFVRDAYKHSQNTPKSHVSDAEDLGSDYEACPVLPAKKTQSRSTHSRSRSHSHTRTHTHNSQGDNSDDQAHPIRPAMKAHSCTRVSDDEAHLPVHVRSGRRKSLPTIQTEDLQPSIKLEPNEVIVISNSSSDNIKQEATQTPKNKQPYCKFTPENSSTISSSSDSPSISTTSSSASHTSFSFDCCEAKHGIHTRHWPDSFTIPDIVDGFSACTKARKQHQSVADIFERKFGVEFHSSTYYAHRKKWREVSEHTQLKFNVIDKTWPEFLEYCHLHLHRSGNRTKSKAHKRSQSHKRSRKY